jgi:hypothetical protein
MPHNTRFTTKQTRNEGEKKMKKKKMKFVWLQGPHLTLQVCFTHW